MPRSDWPSPRPPAARSAKLGTLSRGKVARRSAYATRGAMAPTRAGSGAPGSVGFRRHFGSHRRIVGGLAGGHDPQERGRRPPPTTRWMPRKAGAERQVAAADAGGVGGARWRRVAFAGAASFVVPRSPAWGGWARVATVLRALEWQHWGHFLGSRAHVDPRLRPGARWPSWVRLGTARDRTVHAVRLC